MLFTPDPRLPPTHTILQILKKPPDPLLPRFRGIDGSSRGKNGSVLEFYFRNERFEWEEPQLFIKDSLIDLIEFEHLKTNIKG